MAEPGRIYQRLLSLCPSDCPEEWPGLSLEGVAGRIPAEPDRLARGLLDAFNPEELEYAGIAHPTGGGMMLAECLSVPNRRVVGWRAAPGALPEFLMIEGPSLEGSELAAILDAAAGLEAAPDGRRLNLWVAFSLEDAAILTRAGLAVLPAWAVDWAGPRDLDRLDQAGCQLVIPVCRWSHPRLGPCPEAVDRIGDLRARVEARLADPDLREPAFLRPAPWQLPEMEVRIRRGDGSLEGLWDPIGRPRHLSEQSCFGPVCGILRDGLPVLHRSRFRDGPVAKDLPRFCQARLRIDSLGPVLDLPTRIQLQTKFSGPFAGGVDSDLAAPDLLNGMIVEIPRRHFLGLTEVPPAHVAKELFLRMTGGLRPLERDFPWMPQEGPPEKLLEIAHIPARLDCLYPMRRATGCLTDDRGQGDAGEPVEMVLVEPPPLPCPAFVHAAAEVQLDPQTRRRFLWCEDLTVVERRTRGT